jgi:polar amino acid transport system permease protein
LLNRCHPPRVGLVDIGVAILVVAALVFFVLRMKQVLSYQWDWDRIPSYLMYRDAATAQWRTNMLLQGFFTTLRLSAWSMVLGFALGILSGVTGARGALPFRMLSRLYVESVRNIPSLVLVIMFYFVVSSQFLDALGLDRFMRQQPALMQKGIGLFLAPPGQITAFVSAVCALAIYEGAYISEIVRGGINGIPSGQWEAAWSVGLSQARTFFLVILPQTFRRCAFPLAGQFVSTIKDSAIVSVISIQELTFQGMELMSVTFLTFELWITIALMYFLLTFSLSRVIAFLERRGSLRS